CARARARGEAMPSRRAWLVSAPVGALLFLVGNGLVVVAEQRGVPSSLAAVVCGTTPLLVTALAAPFSALRAVGRPSAGTQGGERPSRSELLGMVLGLAGVVILATRSPLAHAGLGGLMILLAPVGWAIGSLVARAQKGAGVANAAAQMTCGGVWMLAASVASGEKLPG